ncbi:MAG: 2-isopropylmalate synthase [Alphaproteobacteria bacterium]
MNMQKPKNIIIFDTTLRDGEQCPGAAMSYSDKLAIADKLDSMGVDVIEAGFPAASQGDFAAVAAIAARTQNASVAGLARGTEDDLRAVWQAIATAKRPRIHTFTPTSPIHRERKLGKNQAQVLDLITASVGFARNLCADVEWSAEDATRTELDYLCQCVVAAMTAGATTINLPDTVGYSAMRPDGTLEYFHLFKTVMAYVQERVPTLFERVVFSTHCHNDLGLAVANSLAGVMAGARQVECTINGIGERAGNAALEEVVMALHTRKETLGFAAKIDTTQLTSASALVAKATAFPVQYNKAIVGKNAFAHASGIHQDGMLKDARTYEIMQPETVGLAAGQLPLGKHSGSKGLEAKLKQLGYTLNAKELAALFTRFKALADKKKQVEDEDILALLGEGLYGPERLLVLDFTAVQDNGNHHAIVRVTYDGNTRQVEAPAGTDGIVDALVNALNVAVGLAPQVESYVVQSVTEGSDAQAEVFFRVQHNGLRVSGKAVGPDTLAATVHAYARALNKLLNA